MKRYVRLVPFVLFMILGWFLWRGLAIDPHALPSVQLGKPLPPFRLHQLKNEKLVLTEQDLQGQVVVLNVWASWCEACIEEQLFLMTLAKQGVVIVGLNYKDQPKEARAWLSEWGDPYQVIASDLEGRLAIDIGVYGAPETFLIDKQGTIRYRHVGILTPPIWKQEFEPRIHRLKVAI